MWRVSTTTQGLSTVIASVGDRQPESSFLVVYHVDNSYIKPEDHIAWVASLSILGTLFLVIKFTIFFITNYRTKKKLEKEEALVSLI